jgi:hypothetical protein
MYNYKHEIEIPDDRAIRYYLWSDYFHDSQISNIEFVDKSRKQKVFIDPSSVLLTVVSDGDFREAHKCDELSKFYLEPRDKYVYFLRFDECLYYINDMESCKNVYLNGRFKDSALLARLEQGHSKKFYHLRIQTTGGYMDIVFGGFKIRKQEGRVRAKDVEGYDYTKLWIERNLAKDDYGNINRNILISMAESGDDVERYYAISYLASYCNASVLAQARKIIVLDRKEFEMARIAAIWIIGMQGNEQDIQALTEEYFNVSNSRIFNRHILDAIERIKIRTVPANFN